MPRSIIALLLLLLFGPASRAQTPPSGGTGGKQADSTRTRPVFQLERKAPSRPLVGSTMPTYPAALRSANVEGEVLAQFVIDTLGRPDPTTVKVLNSSHALFTAAVQEALPAMRFTPSDIGGRKVRQLIQYPFVFTLGRNVPPSSAPGGGDRAAMNAGESVSAPASASPPRRKVSPDSVLFAGDLDGGGTTDFVVNELRGEDGLGAGEARIAIYLNARRHSRRPNWASAWENPSAVEYSLGESVALAKGVRLLEINGSGGDQDSAWLLLVTSGKIREEVIHSVDYGQGYLRILRTNDRVVIEASPADLEVRHQRVSAAVTCTGKRWPAIQLAYNPTRRQFTKTGTLCAEYR